MKYTLHVEKLHHEDTASDYVEDSQKALDIVELLRLQSGKFVYEYPARLRRVIEITRRN